MTTPNTPKDDLIGKTLGQFEISEEIGRGGMATVYKARQRSMNRTVAIKVLPRQMLHDPGFYERFEREVDVISHLEHPHILPIYDYGQQEGLPYIAMRYLGGGSLEQRIRRERVKIEDIEKPLRQVAQALDYAHQQGIIHRDLKPGNIMLDENGNAYLTDFGIARVLGSDLTGSMIIGTPAYMSPEQANGLPVDGRSDIYSLGIVLFEWITGRGPYQAETPMAVLLKQIQEPMPSIRKIRNDVPILVEDVILKATAKEPAHRFSSAGEFSQAYANAIHGIPFQSARPASGQETNLPVGGNVTAPMPIPTQFPYQPQGTPYPQANTPYPQQSTPYPQQPTPYPTQATADGKRSPLVWILGLIMVAVVVGGGVFAIMSSTNTAPTTTAIPTAFPRSTVINQTVYSLSMLDEFIPRDALPFNFMNLSSDDQTIHAWYDDNQTVFIELAVQTTSASLRQVADDHADASFPEGDAIRFVDEATAEDSTIRKSYRLFSTDAPSISTLNSLALQFPGQLDVFYVQRDGQIAILKMYTADTTGNRYVNTLQAILDSLRIKVSA